MAADITASPSLFFFFSNEYLYEPNDFWHDTTGLNSVSVVCWGEGLAGKQGSESKMQLEREGEIWNIRQANHPIFLPVRLELHTHALRTRVNRVNQRPHTNTRPRMLESGCTLTTEQPTPEWTSCVWPWHTHACSTTNTSAQHGNHSFSLWRKLIM